MRKKFLTLFIALLLAVNNFIYIKAEGYGDFVNPVKKEMTRVDKGDYGFLMEHKENEMTGVYKDKSLVVLEVDGLLTSAIGRSYNNIQLSPFMTLLVSGAVYFNNYFLGSASKNPDDITLSTLYSIMPNQKYPGFKQIYNKDIKGLQNYFKNAGYTTIAQRNLEYGEEYVNYLTLGFDKVNINEKDGNTAVLKSLQKKIEEPGKKFIYAETLPFENPMTAFKGGALEEERTLFVQKIRELDNSLKDFISNFKNSAKAKDTILLIVGKNNVYNDLANKEKTVETVLTKEKKLAEVNCPLIFVNGLQTKKYLNTIGSVDILPTLLNMFGLYENVYPMFGRDVFSKEKKDMDMATVQYDMNNRIAIYKSIAIDIKNADGGLKIDAYNRNGLGYVDASAYELVTRKSFRDSELSYGLVFLNKLKELAENKKILKLDNDKTIMHAGGELCGMTYTNMKEALDKNYSAGKRYFEMDFMLTSDGHPVNIHSWEGFVTKFYGAKYIEGETTYTKAEYDSMKSRHGYTQMDMEKTVEWFRNHKDAYLITDVKTENVKVLEKISKLAPDLKDRIIPQIYKFEEYEPVKKVGFEKIILTLYLSNYTADQLADFATSHNLYAVTMSLSKFEKGLGNRLIQIGVPIFVHTINRQNLANQILEMGARRVYTDTL